MGNQFSCKPPKDTGSSIVKQKRREMVKKKKKRREEEEEAVIMEKGLLSRLLMHEDRGRSSSMRIITENHPKPSALTRSASARFHRGGDPVPNLITSKQDAKLAMNLETDHFLLIHGGGYGAWCWYKSIALLEESGFKATAIDLTGSGIDFTNPNVIMSIKHYAKPLMDFLEKLPEKEKVILVGHDFGGACISYAMEHFPKKIAKSVFVAAAMVANGQRAYDVFDLKVVTPDDLLLQTQTFVYANGSDNSPTAIEFDKKILKDLLFNQSPAKDVALASVSLRAIPFAPVLEKLCLTEENYGQVPRYFIMTAKDYALTPAIQKNIVTLNPPKSVFKLKGSDHSPFFSKPQGLHNIFMEIAQL